MNKSSKARSLALMTALIAIVILAAAWFLLLAPVLNATSEAEANAQAQEDQNANTQIQVNKLKAQFANMPEYETQLEALQVQIPTTQDYANLQRQFAAIAEAHNVVITSLEFGSAAPIEEKKPDDAAGETTDPEDDSAGAPSADPTAEPDASGNGAGSESKDSAKLYGIPASVTMTGKYDDLMAALNELQTGEDRLILITDVEIAPSDLLDAEEGDTIAVFAGQTFVLTSSTPAESQPAGEGSSPSPSPSPAP